MSTPRSSAIGALTIEDINRALADLQQQIQDLTGEGGTVILEDRLTVDGSIDCTGSLQIRDANGTLLHGFGDKDAAHGH